MHVGDKAKTGIVTTLVGNTDPTENYPSGYLACGSRLYNNFFAAVNVQDIDSSQFRVEAYGDVGPVTDVTVAQTASITATGNFALDNLSDSPCVPVKGFRVIQTSGAGGLASWINYVAKHMRGRGVGSMRHRDNVLEGALATIADQTLATPLTTTLGPTNMNGLNRVFCWTQFIAALDITSFTGTSSPAFSCEIKGDLGTTSADTGTPKGCADIVLATVTVSATGAQKVVLANKTYGSMIKPTKVVWTNTSGTITDLDATLGFVARFHPGQAGIIA